MEHGLLHETSIEQKRQQANIIPSNCKNKNIWIETSYKSNLFGGGGGGGRWVGRKSPDNMRISTSPILANPQPQADEDHWIFNLLT